MRLVPALATLALLPSLTMASERVFTYVYQSPVAPLGSKEIEVWSTQRRGRDGMSYARQDNRLELEVGVLEGVQTAVYLNQTRVTVDGDSETESSVSWEWKWQLSDPAADRVGSAIYGEVSAASDEMSAEVKYIVDKQLGANDLIAAHAKLEPEWKTAPGDFALAEWEIEFSAGWSHRLTPRWRAGLELRSYSVIEKEVEADGTTEWKSETSALFGGPNVHGDFGAFWFTGTVLPQLYAFDGTTGDDTRDLEHQERLQIRFLAGFHF